MPTDDTLRLCFVKDQWAWFTSAPLAQQWGDDWNDRPYEHNAGNPYPWNPTMALRDIHPYVLCKVAYDGALYTPADDAVLNSLYSVEEINAQMMPWLRSRSWRSDEDVVQIWAGTPYDEFLRLVKQVGGTVYAPVLPVPVCGGCGASPCRCR